MTEHSHDPPPESWDVPQRRAMIVAVSVPVALLAMLFLAGRLYDRDLRPQHLRPVTAFPAPGLESAVHDGGGDPHRIPDSARGEPAVEAAKRDVVAEGWR